MQNTLENLKEAHKICAHLISNRLFTSVELTNTVEAEIHIFSSLNLIQKVRVIVHNDCITNTICTLNLEETSYYRPNYYLLCNKLSDKQEYIILKYSELENLQKFKKELNNDKIAITKIGIEKIGVNELLKLFDKNQGIEESRLIG
jgi:hypothetical protein